MARPNYLFVCSRNQWRSRTAETIFRADQRFHVRSAGTAKGARIPVTERLLAWADAVFVMEEKHREILRQKFPVLCNDKIITVLDIPDEYRYMDAELIDELKSIF